MGKFKDLHHVLFENSINLAKNSMPLSRYALYAQGVEVYLAPTWDCGESWLGTLRHIAREGGCWVAGCSTAIQCKDIPDSVPHKAEVFPEPEDWLSNGDAVLFQPFGGAVAGPMTKEKGILYSEYDLGAVIDGKRSLDIGGHYAGPIRSDAAILAKQKYEVVLPHAFQGF